MTSSRELSRIEREILKAIGEFEIIDCHEHLGPEKERVESAVDVFNFFSAYTGGDLSAAGMSQSDYQSLFNHNIPLERRWALFAPYWEQIRWGSYARAALLAAKKLYGFEDINDKTFQPLSQAMKEANKSGIYERILRNECKIRTALTVSQTTKLDTPLLTPVMKMMFQMQNWEAISHPFFDPDAKVRSLDDYLGALRDYIIRVKAEGAVALKMASKPYERPIREKALSTFERMRKGIQSYPVPFAPALARRHPLMDYVVDQMISLAAEHGLVVAVHTGYWGDFRELHPLHMLPIIQRHPETRFDIYHLGYPWVRETLMLGKRFPNVWLNFCWTHIISQRFAMAALDEAIDLIPVNKLLAFGGDYGPPAVEKVYGHLVMAQENVACVLAKRIVKKQMSETQALTIARKWFWENPKQLYHLKL